MRFDPVHDLQEAFRGLLEAFSFPGRRVDLSVPAQRMAVRVADGTVMPSLALGAAALVDQESPYAVAGGPGLGAFLREWASAAPGALEEAAVVVVSGWDDRSLAALLERVSSGTLSDPHRGATVLVETDDLDAGASWVLSGPGLEAPQTWTLPGGLLWPAVRNRRNSEFPLGVDLAFFDRRGRVAALPRTTRLVPAGGV